MTGEQAAEDGERFLKKSQRLLRAGDGVATRYEAIEAEKANFPIAIMCDAMEISRSGYYAWLGREPSDRAKDAAALASEITSVFEASRGTYGSPRVHAELQEQGRHVSRKRVERQMRELGLMARRKPKFRWTTDSNHREPVAPN